MNNYLYAISKTFSTLPSSVGGGACGFNWIGSGGGEATWRGGGGSCRFTWIAGGGGTCGLTWVPGGGGGVVAAVSRLTRIGGIGGGGGGGGGGGSRCIGSRNLCHLYVAFNSRSGISNRSRTENKKKKKLVQHKPKKMVLVMSASKRLVSVIPLSLFVLLHSLQMWRHVDLYEH